MKNRRLISLILALALTLMMTVVLAGCGQKQQSSSDQSTQTQTEQPATEDTAATNDTATTNDTAATTTDGSAATQKDSEYIGEDKALEIALADAGLSKDQISNSFVKLDYEDDTGRYEYEVKFYKDTTEYEYDIDAITGEITDKDIDFD